MSALGPELEGADVLDLFAGSGALGLEALSRGARHATFIENDARALKCLRANINTLGAGELSMVVSADVFGYIDRLAAGSFDIALADPPYGHGLAGRLVGRFRREPFARILCVEHGHTETLDLAPDAHERRYGDTVITFIPAPDSEEGRS